MPQRELASVNTFYGHADVLRKYADVPGDEPIYGIIPHSPAPDPSFVWNGERLPHVPAVLCYPDYRIAAFEWATSKAVLPAASPYVYVARLADSTSQTERRGTIFFPSHSSHHVTVDQGAERLADALLQVEGPYIPVTVCMYWRDVQLGRHRPFLDRGFGVVSAGHMFDPLFLFRLHELCSRHRFASGNKIGSHIFLSVASGCTYVQLGPVGSTPPSYTEVRRRRTSQEGVRVPDRELDLRAVRNVRATFLGPSPDPDAQRRASDYFLGSQHAVSPEDLRMLFRRLWRADKTQVLVRRRNGPPQTAVPPFLARLPSSLKRLVRRLLLRLGLMESVQSLLRRFR